ncbi:MAG: hypothetical protein HY763_15625 [Planctomycetes bacterium]|nr:hypothetical protein [Planctomycetota bacterium]
MDRRTRILLGVFGLGVGYVFLTRVAYPLWIEPLVTLDERIVKAGQELEKLEEQQARVDHAKREYRRMAERAGALDINKVENAIRARLNELLERHHLEETNITPSRGARDTKTGIERMHLTVSATGTLEAVVAFLRDTAELPHLIRQKNVSISPASTSRQNKRTDRVAMRLPIEVLVLPQHKMLGERLVETEFQPPESKVRHSGADYTVIWRRAPFKEFEDLKPLVAEAGHDLEVEKGKPAQINVSISGGDGKYTCKWEPTEGLNVNGCRATVDTSSVRERTTYNIQVNDDSGNAQADTISVTVREPPPPPPTVPQEQTKIVDAAPPPPKRFPDYRQMQLVGMWESTDTKAQRQKVVVLNGRTNERTAHALGEEFDGGELVYVHPRGAVVRRQSEYYLYPMGAKLDQDLKADAAVNLPRLQAAVERLRQADERNRAAAQPAAAAEPAAKEGVAPPLGVPYAPPGETAAPPQAEPTAHAAGSPPEIAAPTAPDSTGPLAPPAEAAPAPTGNGTAAQEGGPPLPQETPGAAPAEPAAQSAAPGAAEQEAAQPTEEVRKKPRISRKYTPRPGAAGKNKPRGE